MNISYVTRNSDNIPVFNGRHNFFEVFLHLSKNGTNSYLASVMKAVFNVFQKQILKLVRPAANSVFNCHNPKGIKYVTRPRLRLTH